MQRRKFIQTIAQTGISVPLMHYGIVNAFASPDGRLGHIATPTLGGDRILVILRMFGGNDGLNTIVPIHDDEYYRVRKVTSQHDLSIAEDVAIPIEGHDGFGFHPSMSALNELYQEGNVAVIQGVGYPNMDLSHFRGNDIWLSASDADVYETSGWVGRTIESQLDHKGGVLSDTPYAVEFGQVMGRLLHGRSSAHGHVYHELSKFHGEDEVIHRAFGHAKSTLLHDRMVTSQRYGQKLDAALAKIPGHSRAYPEGSPLATSMMLVSRMIRSGLGTQVYVVHAGQFDTHHYQQEVHAQQLTELFNTINAFQRELEDHGDAGRVCIMPISEFGRRVEPTESGTDHGTAAPVFVIGRGVTGGIYGTAPLLTELDANGNLLWNVDFREIYSAILHDWFGADKQAIDSEILGRSYRPLPIFNRVVSVGQREQLQLSIAPTPVTDFVLLRSTWHQARPGTATIYDSSGRRIGAFRVDLSSDQRLPIGRLTSGVYVLVVLTDDGSSWRQAFPVEHR